MDNGVDAVIVFKSHSPRLAEVYAALFDAHLDDVKREVNWNGSDADPIYNPNLLFIESLKVDAEHTGQGAELLALRGLIFRLRAGVGLTAIPAPAFSDQAGLARLGFKPFFETMYWVRGTTHLLPAASGSTERGR